MKIQILGKGEKKSTHKTAFCPWVVDDPMPPAAKAPTK